LNTASRAAYSLSLILAQYSSKSQFTASDNTATRAYSLLSNTALRAWPQYSLSSDTASRHKSLPPPPSHTNTHMHIYADRWTDKTDRQTDRQRNRHRHRHTRRQTRTQTRAHTPARHVHVTILQLEQEPIQVHWLHCIMSQFTVWCQEPIHYMAS
jgi:hypothetical protein